MKSYYSSDDITVYCAKAEEIVPHLPKRYFAVLVLDAPYTFSFEKTPEILQPFNHCLKAGVQILNLMLTRIPVAPAFGHPHSRDLEQIERLLSATEGAILDPYMGSGTTLVAAMRLGREAVGIEMCEKYCKAAVERIEAA